MPLLERHPGMKWKGVAVVGLFAKDDGLPEPNHAVFVGEETGGNATVISGDPEERRDAYKLAFGKSFVGCVNQNGLP